MKSYARMLTVVTLAALASAPAIAADGLHPVLGASVTFGGEKLATVEYTDGSSQSIKSGGLVHLFGGAEYQSGKFALQVNVGYHVDDTSASNGSVKFSRVPVEVLGFWNVADKVRLGGGIRKATDAKIKGSGAASSLGSVSLDSDVGVVLQVQYFFDNDKFSAFARYVAEDYKVSGTSVGGKHGGIGVSYRF